MLLLLLWLSGEFAFLARAALNFGDGEVELAAGGIDFDDDDFARVADADAFAGALAADDARAGVDVPPVVHEIFIFDQAIDEVFVKLDEDAEVRDAGDNAGEFLADLAL